MKNFFYTCCLILLSVPSFGQFATYKAEEDRIGKLKSCSMLVIGVDNPAASKWVKFQENAAKYWSLTPIKVMRYSDAKRFTNKANIATLQYSISTGGTHDKVGFTMSKGPGGIGNRNPTTNAKSMPLLNIFIYGKEKSGGNGYQPVFSQLADNSARPNLSVYTLINFLRVAQAELSRSGKDFDFYDNDKIIKKENLAKLQNEELIIPDDEIIHFPPKKPAAEIKKEFENLTKDLSMAHRIVSVEEADSLILNDAPVSIFCYARFNSEKYIFVIDNVSGELLYKDHSLFTYPIKDKDFADLNKAYLKAKK